MRFNRFLIHSALVGGCALLASASSFAAAPVGELEVRGQARVTQATDQGTLNLRNTSYGWFSGDRVDTRNAQAVLNLDSGASLGFGENTRASVSVEGGIAVELESGVVLYAVEDSAGHMTLTSGDYTFTTAASSQPQVLQVSNDSGWSMGIVQRMDDGSLQVSVREGALNASNAAGAVQYQVEAGDSVSFADGEVRQVQVQVQAAEQAGGGGVAGGLLANPAVIGLAVVGAAYGTFRVGFSSSDDDPDPAPVSP